MKKIFLIPVLAIMSVQAMQQQESTTRSEKICTTVSCATKAAIKLTAATLPLIITGADVVNYGKNAVANTQHYGENVNSCIPERNPLVVAPLYASAAFAVWAVDDLQKMYTIWHK